MNYNQLLNSQKTENAYLLVGDGFLVQKSLNFLKEKLNIQSEYDVSRFDSENFSADAIIESCEQVSFFAQNRLVVVSNINTVNESDKKKLANYVSQINPMCTLVFVDNLQKGTFDFLKIEKVNLVLNELELKDFVVKLFKQKGKTITPQTASELVGYCNKDINKLNLETEKLCAYIAERQEVTIDDIKLLVPQSEEVVVFELTTALGQKNASKSLSILYKLMGTVEQNNKLFALMSTNFQRMFFAVASKGLTNAQIAQKFGVKEFAISKVKELAKNFTIGALKDIVYQFCEVEFMIKNGLMAQENALVYIAEYILNR